MPSSQPERWFLLVWLLITSWLLMCAFAVQGEYGDGYQTIVNARYLFGDSPTFYVQRGPLAALLLWPVEVLVRLFGIDPVDVRPHHVYSALWHSAYLLGCWVLLRRAPGDAPARLIAFGASILSVVFYAYAPYLSHDIVPGLLFTAMIFLVHRWLRRPHRMDAVCLVLLGAAVTLFKQTFAIFWVALIAYGITAWSLGWDSGRVTPRKLAGLVLMAGGSAAISWLGYAWFIGDEIPDAAFLIRPVQLIAAVSAQYGGDLQGAFATDLYLRNLPNYGIAAMLLVIPGIVMALRGDDPRLRQVAFCWLFAALLLQFSAFREARYLAFLAPLTALLIVPVIHRLVATRPVLVVLLALVLVDQSRGLSQALKPMTSTARIDVARFLNAPRGDGDLVVSKTLSFVYDGASPLRRDRYHGIYHLTPLNLSGLYEGRLHVAAIDDPRHLGSSGIKPGDRVYYSNNTMLRRPPWDNDNLPSGLASYLLVAGDAVSAELVLRDDSYQRSDDEGGYVMYFADADRGQRMPVISSTAIAADAARELYGAAADGSPLSVTVIRIMALCQADACSYR